MSIPGAKPPSVKVKTSESGVWSCDGRDGYYIKSSIEYFYKKALKGVYRYDLHDLHPLFKTLIKAIVCQSCLSLHKVLYRVFFIKKP